MYKKEGFDDKYYSEIMNSLIEENKKYVGVVTKSFEYRVKQIIDELLHKQYMYLLYQVIRKIFKKAEKKDKIVLSKTSFMSDKKIAVYTCITGQYDYIKEPLFVPNNCDFFLVTDQKAVKTQKWRVVDIDLIDEIKYMNAKDKNRFVKMHPELLFYDYDYSIYLDGNIQIVVDPTVFIQNMNRYGITTYRHTTEKCIYREAKKCILAKKASKSEIEKHVKFLNKEKMPVNYGMAYCGFIVREHRNKICQEIMDEWWKQYSQYSKRDQISFPYILFKKGIAINEITVLGDDIYSDYSLRNLPHFFRQ